MVNVKLFDELFAFEKDKEGVVHTIQYFICRSSGEDGRKEWTTCIQTQSISEHKKFAEIICEDPCVEKAGCSYVSSFVFACLGAQELFCNVDEEHKEVEK